MKLRQVKIKVSGGHAAMNNEGKVKPLPIKYAMGSFHTWEQHKDDEGSWVFAIVEMEDGSIKKFLPEEIQFTGKPDGANLFEDGL